MNYKKKIHLELQPIAKKVPYNKMIIKFANIFLKIAFHLTRTPKDVINRHITIDGSKGLKLKVEIFEPIKVKEKLPCLIYVHGGAFSYKASTHHKKLACIYAIKAKCRVYFPDYHLTPKYPYPVAYEDVLSLYQYVSKNAEDLNINNEKIGIAGDSAGASIATLICNNYELEKLKKPCFQMLIYPLTDIDMKTDSMKIYIDTPLWNAKNNQRMWSYYCKGVKENDLYKVSPMHNTLAHEIPNTYIETAEFDCLHDEGILYGKRLEKAGADVEINETKETIHGYDCALHTKIVMCNIEKRIKFLRKSFYGKSSVE